MITAKITNIGKGRIQQTGEEFLDVAVDLIERTEKEGAEPEETLIAQRRFGYPLDTLASAVEADVAKFVEAYKTDAENAERNAETEARHAAADKTIEELSGKEIGAPEKTE